MPRDTFRLLLSHGFDTLWVEASGLERQPAKHRRAKDGPTHDASATKELREGPALVSIVKMYVLFDDDASFPSRQAQRRYDACVKSTERARWVVSSRTSVTEGTAS